MMAGKSVISLSSICDFIVEKKLIRKGENSVNSGFVKKIMHDDRLNTIRAEVQASMKQKLYKVEIVLHEGEIQKASCDCPKGLDICHHMAAACIFAHKNLSVTDKACEWIKPKSQSDQVPLTAEECFRTSRGTFNVLVNEIDETSIQQFKEDLQLCGPTGLGWLLSPEPDVENTTNIVHIEDILFSEEYMNAENQTRYLLDKLILSDERILQLERLSVGQSANSLWHIIRKNRITASNFGKIIKATLRARYPPSLFQVLKSNQTLDGIKQIQWGRNNECNAIKLFEEKNKVEVRKTGIWLHPCGFLGATPDGLVGDDTIIEVKCPYKFKDNNLTDALANVRDYILHTENGNFIVNKTHDYYHQIQDYGTYDFIVVGAGSTGAVIAARLSENSKYQVLVLEAGDEENDFSDIPGMQPYLWYSKMDWGYYTTPQRGVCQAIKDGRCKYPRGKVIGGTGTISALMYVRGSTADFDGWAAKGCTGWSYKEVLPYFLKSENSLVQGDYNYHTTAGWFTSAGPWTVSFSEPLPPLYQTFFDGNIAMGRKNLDFNGASQMGFQRTPYNIKNGKRQSSGRAFLDPARSRSNLKIAVRAYVTKILIEDNKATGVEFLKDGKKYQAKASKEVIVSAGAINTPQLLMLSGIGPQRHLRNLGIDLVKDLPVGQRLKDHVLFYSMTFRTNTTTTDVEIESQIKDYLAGKGILTRSENAAMLGFKDVKDGWFAKAPDVEYMFISPGAIGGTPARQQMLTDELLTHFNNINPKTDFSIYLILLKPISEGVVTLKSKNPIDFPDINIGTFSDWLKRDREKMYRGIQWIMDLINTPPFQKINAELIRLPICKWLYIFNSRDYWFCVLDKTATPMYHTIGTARMGKEEDAVVDPELKVYGVGNLRVADCSIIPEVTSGHPNAVAVMIGEKAADMIKKQYP